METFELLRSLLAEKVKDNAEITPRTNLRELALIPWIWWKFS